MRALIPGVGLGDVYWSAWCAAPTFGFRKGYDEQTVQFLIIEMLDSIRQVLGQDMPPLIRRCDPICRGKCFLRRRGLASGGRMILSHGRMMPRSGRWSKVGGVVSTAHTARRADELSGSFGPQVEST